MIFFDKIFFYKIKAMSNINKRNFGQVYSEVGIRSQAATAFPATPPYPTQQTLTPFPLNPNKLAKALTLSASPFLYFFRGEEGWNPTFLPPCGTGPRLCWPDGRIRCNDPAPAPGVGCGEGDSTVYSRIGKTPIRYPDGIYE